MTTGLDKQDSIPTLRPMTLGEILDRAFHIYRRKFPLLVTVSAIPASILLAIYLADEFWVDSNSLVLKSSVTAFGRTVIGLLVGLVYYHIIALIDLPFTAAIVKQASGAVLDEACSVTDSLRFFRKRWIGYLWISALKVTGTLVVPELLAVGVFLGMGF